MDDEFTLFDFISNEIRNTENSMKISNYNDLVMNIEKLEMLKMIDYKSRILTKGRFLNSKVFYRVEYKDVYDECFYSMDDILHFLKHEKSFLKSINN